MAKPRGPLEEESVPRKPCATDTREAAEKHLDTGAAPGKQERTIWTACEAGRKGSIGQPARHQGGTREAGRAIRTAWEALGRQERTIWTAWEAPGRQERTHWTACKAGRKEPVDSLRGTREAPGRQERTIWTACEAPGRQERIHWTACEAPGRQERTIWTAWEAPGRHQGGRKPLKEEPVLRGPKIGGLSAPS